MKNQKELDQLFSTNGYTDFKWVKAEDIVVSQWVRFKCQFGCKTYGTKGSCPPQVPDVSACREFFREYSRAVIFHFAKRLSEPEKRAEWTLQVNLELLELERQVFLAGYQKAFLLFMDECCLCRECPGTRVECKNKSQSRPGPEALAMDVFSTVRKYGYPIQVLSDYNQTMNRYAFLMIE